MMIVVPTTTVPAISIPTFGYEDVRELQEPTYTPTDEQIIAATSTRNLEQRAIKVMEAYLPQREYTLEQVDVVIKILEIFPDEPVMVSIAFCESGLNPTADRESLGVDVGLFQINQVHNHELNRLGLDRLDLTDNITYAKILYDQTGLQPWYMSRHCWQQYV